MYVLFLKALAEDTKHTRDRKIFNKAEVESNHDIVDQKLKNLINELERTTFELKLYHIKYGIDEEIIKKVNNMRDYFEIELDLPVSNFHFTKSTSQRFKNSLAIRLKPKDAY